ncbi:MAG: hypothetical protein ACXIVE_01070 [Salinarimonas sp.]
MSDLVAIIRDGAIWAYANHAVLLSVFGFFGLLFVLRAFGLVGPIRYENDGDTTSRLGGGNVAGDCGDNGGD